jgi:hypothetical protein
MELPKSFDLTPSGKIVQSKEYGESGYIENECYELQITLSHNGNLVIEYYSDDDNYLNLTDFIKLLKKCNK